MAKINNLTSYPTATPPLSANSIVIGSIASGGATNNFLMSDISTYVMGANTLTLQDVCDNGTATTTGITVGGAVDINSTADISDTLTLSKATGTGLQVDSDVNIDGDLFVNSIEADAGNLIINDSASFERMRLTAAGAFVFQGDASFASKFILSAGAPSSASDTGTKDEVAIDANYIYICTATDTWKRVAIATW